MAINIKKKCVYCDCIFEYESNDVEYLEDSPLQLVTCPDCGETLLH